MMFINYNDDDTDNKNDNNDNNNKKKQLFSERKLPLQLVKSF